LTVLRLQDNPPTIWPQTVPLAEINQPWTAVYCKPRQEKALAWDLVRRKVAYYLPMTLRQTSSGGRRRQNMYPLFPSYLFFAGGERERLAVVKTDRVVRFIEISSVQQNQFKREITYLDTALQNCPESIELYPRLIPGARVRITAGPMRDVEGIIVQSHNKRKLLLGVSVLGVGATVEIHADLVSA
jgi:transcription antitermination factor NusG